MLINASELIMTDDKIVKADCGCADTKEEKVVEVDCGCADKKDEEIEEIVRCG